MASPPPKYSPAADNTAPHRSSSPTMNIEPVGSMAPENFIEKVEPYANETCSRADFRANADTRSAQTSNAKSAAIEEVGAPAYVTPLSRLGEEPAWIDCPFCKDRTQTRVGHEDSTATTLAGVLCCLVCICFACLPCMLGWCQDTNHYCTKCQKRVTHKPHDGTVQVMEQPRPIEEPSRYARAGQSQNQNGEPTSKMPSTPPRASYIPGREKLGGR